MDRDTTIGIIVIAILTVGMVSIPIYFSLTSPKVEITSTIAVSTNNGLVTNASFRQGFVQIGQNFTVLVFLSPQWSVIVRNVSVATPGFLLVSVNESLPQLVEQNMTLSLTVQANQSYSGSVLFIIGSNNASNLPEKILIPDVLVDIPSKAVTLISVRNAGDVMLTNSTAYLIRSDGLVVNQSSLPTAGMLPGNIVFYDVNMSYSEATKLEIYHVVVETAGGANATSRAIWLTCDC